MIRVDTNLLGGKIDSAVDIDNKKKNLDVLSPERSDFYERGAYITTLRRFK